jgi:hypothetical protein
VSTASRVSPAGSTLPDQPRPGQRGGEQQLDPALLEVGDPAGGLGEDVGDHDRNDELAGHGQVLVGDAVAGIGAEQPLGVLELVPHVGDGGLQPGDHRHPGRGGKCPGDQPDALA